MLSTIPLVFTAHSWALVAEDEAAAASKLADDALNAEAFCEAKDAAAEFALAVAEVELAAAEVAAEV